MPATVDTRFFFTYNVEDTQELKLKTSRRMIELQREVAIVPTIVLHEVCKFMRGNVGRDADYLIQALA